MPKGILFLTCLATVLVLATPVIAQEATDAVAADGARRPGPEHAPRFAAEHVWALDYYLRDDLKAGSEEQTRANLDRLLRKASDILQDRHREGDTPCPIRLAARRVEYFSLGDPRFPGAGRKRGELRFPAELPGVYLAPGPGPSFATGQRIYVWLEPEWGRLKTSGGWALAHEHGHLAGLMHLDVRRGAPCQLMSYGPLAAGCGGGRILRETQCRAYLRAAPETEGVTRCLLEDPSGDGIGVRPAPRGMPCSDGSGTCDGKGLCLPPAPGSALLGPPR